jgi:hypothetical protein
MQAAGEKALAAMGGALEKTVRALLPLLPPPPPPRADVTKLPDGVPADTSDQGLRRAVS